MYKNSNICSFRIADVLPISKIVVTFAEFAHTSL